MENPIVKGQYETADNPILKCFIWQKQKRFLQISPVTRREPIHFKDIL